MARNVKWSGEKVLAALRAIPAPLRDSASAEAFDDAVCALQEVPGSRDMKAVAKEASAEMIRVIRATASSRQARRYADELLNGLRLLAYTGTPEAVACTVELAGEGLASDDFMWTMVFDSYGDDHPHTARLFQALGKKIPAKFIGIAFLDAANTAARDHGFKPHPFDSAQGVKILRAHLSDASSKNDSYAVSACAAIPFLSAARRKPLIALARKHKDPQVRMEVAWAMAKLGDKTSIQYLVDQCLDRNSSLQAQEYLREIGHAKLIPRDVREPEFAALAEMCNWLKHPNEYGEAPDSIELMDKREIYWPPLKKSRTVRLFSFVYNKSRNRPKRDVGVGMVGTMTWAFFDETKPSMKPQDIYGLHCCLELEHMEDARAPRKRSAKAGWKLIAAGK